MRVVARAGAPVVSYAQDGGRTIGAVAGDRAGQRTWGQRAGALALAVLVGLAVVALAGSSGSAAPAPAPNASPLAALCQTATLQAENESAEFSFSLNRAADPGEPFNATCGALFHVTARFNLLLQEQANGSTARSCVINGINGTECALDTVEDWNAVAFEDAGTDEVYFLYTRGASCGTPACAGVPLCDSHFAYDGCTLPVSRSVSHAKGESSWQIFYSGSVQTPQPLASFHPLHTILRGTTVDGGFVVAGGYRSFQNNANCRENGFDPVMPLASPTRYELTQCKIAE